MRRAGSPLTKEGLNCDVKIILGYGPLAHRPLLLGDAAGQNVSTKDIAAALQTTEAMVRKAIALLAEIKNRKANSATEIVLAPDPSIRLKEASRPQPENRPPGRTSPRVGAHCSLRLGRRRG